MKQLLRAGLCMLAVLAALVVFRLSGHSTPEARPVSVAASTAAPTAAPVSVTLPPPTTVPLPPTPSPTPPPFTTGEEAEAYLLARLENDGYAPAADTDALACFGDVPACYKRLEGVYTRPDPGTGQGKMTIQYWYCLDPARILTLQQVFGEPVPQGSNSLAYYNLRNYPFFQTTGWVNYRANYSTNIGSSYVFVGLDTFDKLSEDQLAFMTQIS